MSSLAGPSSLAPLPAAANPAPACGPAPSATTNRLYVGNLASSVDEYALMQLFQRFGKLTKLDFMYHKTGTLKGKPRGYAFVELQSKEDAHKAMLKLHDRLLRGRKLVVTPASSVSPGPTQHNEHNSNHYLGDELIREAPPLPDNAPVHNKGRRSEPARTTTLSLLKSKGKGKQKTSAAAQIAAMEAKLAAMQRRKPADEDYTPGQGSKSTGTATPELDAGATGDEMDIEEELGLVGGQEAAEELEREMAGILKGVGEPGTDNSAIGDGPSSTELATAPPLSVSQHAAPVRITADSQETEKRAGKNKEKDEAAKKAEVIQRGFANLPRRPAA